MTMLGKKHSEKTKRKISLKHLGRNNPMYGKKSWNSGLTKKLDKRLDYIRPTEFKKGENLRENNPVWKGKNVKYAGLHMWIKSNFGVPKKCMLCGTKEKRTYHWINKDGNYTRNKEDWTTACVPCHKRYDLKRSKNYE